MSLSLNSIYNDFKNLDYQEVKRSDNSILLKKSISIQNLNYQYPNTSHSTIKDMNFEIPAFSTVAFVGSTGSGKTTIVDIILGLLQAQKEIL